MGIESMELRCQHLERVRLPGAFPSCYGPDEFSQLPRRCHRLDSQGREHVWKQAEGLAEATGRPRSEAADVLLACEGDSATAFVRLLTFASTERLMEAVACSREDAEQALRACKGDESLAACQLLDNISTIERKRPRQF